jgi:peptidoglycan/xylan/chitin deacetylase (PgdA/CDA1 family)
MDVILTIDTEADNQWDRSKTDLSTDNLEFIPRFQELCRRYNLKPTYLCTWEIVGDPRFDSLRRYQEAGLAEIGSHLHPWTTPPMEHSQNGLDLDAFGTYPSELDPAILVEKLRRLTERIHSRTGVKPRSYRAGRWGFSAEHIPTLVSLGYLVDCSVTPLKSWKHTPGNLEGGPDFRAAPAAPYFLDPNDVCRSGESRLLEVPVTILFTNTSLARSERLQDLYFRYGRTLPVKAMARFFRLDPQWFRPYAHMSSERLKAVYEAARQAELPAVQMMFHSSELMPGGSPYHPDEAAIERLYDKLETVFGHLQDESCTGMTLSEFAQEYASQVTRFARQPTEGAISQDRLHPAG